MQSILFFLFVFFTVTGRSQQTNPAAQLAHHIADKMKDSLGLTNQQRAKVFTINMDLFKEKADARGKSAERNAVGKNLQKIEATRDERYKAVLTTAQYTLYLNKKQNLVTSQ